MKTKIDIEKLLQWAVGDELPKGRPVAADIGFAIGRSDRARPMMIARSMGRVRDDEADVLGFVPGEPCRDAVTISDAIARLPTSVPIASEHDARNLFGADLVGIAEHCIAPLMLSQFNMQAIVSTCAAQRKRPSWQFEHPMPSQMFVQTVGRPRPLVHGVDAAGDLVEMRRNEGKRRKLSGEYTLAMAPRSPLHWHRPSPLRIGETRAEYVAWYAGLDLLASRLAGKLVGFEVLRPQAPALPWITGEDVARVIKGRDLRDGNLDPMLTPRRRAAGKPVESPIEAETIASYNRASRKKHGKTVAA